MQNYNRLKDLREDRDLRQADIAKELGIPQQQYNRYETGKFEIKFHQVIELAKFYNVSLDYLAGLTNDKRKYW